ncbi:helix-turn-helix transcriptional regulator [Ancylobacter sp. MQZ15Z-1]|uniref:Helix-turn-helix transcriptional regulator n=1 Tax=Ancylobacter mangrovi TaxID=2972472 RepID=A0A9X2T400_9HYPH|nr:helix-turn-helix transcriptional regulator [Ancylobacter mangrovi]MCS0497692.1 helix-turn-helix transcriptional regulator [Ancylobacter mangrovi]
MHPSRQSLSRDGVPVRIGARAFDLLTLLVRRSGDLVSKKELLQFGWPDTFVHEGNLKVNVAALRRVLAGTESDASDASYIATVPGRGYRFVVPVAVEPMAPPAEPSLPTAPAAPVHSRTLPALRPLIGRRQDIARLADRLAGARCLSIVGPGGVGKTTVAVAVAHEARAGFADGISFVDLSTIDDPQYVPAAIAAGIGARQAADDGLAGIIDALHERRVLLLLDNCEHLAPAVAATVERLTTALPLLTVLATSREPLRVAPEYVHRLPTLEVPAPGRAMTAEQALEFPAIRLFVTRARERCDYALTDADAPLVSAICQRLDGIALAIELAASKIGAYDVATLLQMLEQRFQLLSNGPRQAPLRQQTLLATLDWSYRLLSDDEATLLRFLSVFAGVFHLQDAIAVAEAAGLAPAQAIDAIERLTARSLVAVEYRDGALHYRLLDSTRAYAGERLAAAGEQNRAMARYARHVLSLFERADEQWSWREKQEWLAEYAGRIDDLRKVMAWAFGPKGGSGAGGDGLPGIRMLGVRLTAAAIPLWDELSSVAEARARVDSALLAVREIGDCPAELKMKLAAARASGMNFAQTLVPETEAAWLDCYRLGVEADSLEYQLRGLWGLSIYLVFTGRPLEAIGRLGEFMELAEAHADWSAIHEGERVLAMAETYIGRLASARQRLDRLAAYYRQPKERARIARFQLDRLVAIGCSLAFLLWLTGGPARAARVAEDAVDRADAIGHIVSQSNALAFGAIPIALWSGDEDGAARFQAMLEDNLRRENIAVWSPLGRFFRSALRARQGAPGGVAEMKARLAELIAGRFVVRAPMYHCMLAETLLAAGEIEEARGAVRDARASVQAQSEMWCLAEVLRLDGLVHLRAGRPEEAERLMAKAIRAAQEIGALSLEVRAALALAAKLEAECRLGEAFEVLEACHARSSGDYDFADLAAARERLRERLGKRGQQTASA